MSASDFWLNRIRKDFKGKDDKQIAFCDALKAMLQDLMEYVTEYHKFGLAWNAKSGVSLAEAILLMTDEQVPDESERTAGDAGSIMVSPKRRRPTAVGSGLGSSSLVAELAQRRSKDGASAATGLKHVRAFRTSTWVMMRSLSLSHIVMLALLAIRSPKINKRGEKSIKSPVPSYQPCPRWMPRRRKLPLKR
jgi:hypothetical protein